MNIAVKPVHARDTLPVAIIGAGPYGLATAAHLRAAGVAFRIFGNAVSFWRGHMPDGMKLRSPWVATHIADPNGRHTLDDYYAEAGMEVPKLLPVENFVGYGMWFQQRVAPDLDTRKVMRVEAFDGGFRLVLEDGDTVFAQRVVMALGLLGHEFRPAQFDGLPRALVSHSCEHTTSEQYRGKRVAVIGRGQSGCEAAAILHEAGADVEIICRGDLVWNADPGKRSALRKAVRAMLGNMLIPPSQVGPFPHNWVNEVPGIIQHMPQETRDRWNELNLRATAITWLKPRLKDVPIDQGRTIFAARRVGDQVSLTLDNATKRYDHVMLATGYRHRRRQNEHARAQAARKDRTPWRPARAQWRLGIERARPAFRRRRRGRQLRAAAALHRRRRICGAARHPRGAAGRYALRRQRPGNLATRSDILCRQP